MIATITLNPSVDICYYLDNLLLNQSNRIQKYYKTPGGKGINVSKVLTQLGVEVAATGFWEGQQDNSLKRSLRRCLLLPGL
ncbi:hypothetical protein N752_19315 [Desulforamulus aquiferis]|nr:hypothetical protein N752_19315 [Desulforamulus aquiferis]